ncbi:MAG TPA: phenylalanine--tRNA ligase subunit beta [Gammaproteobacteria bacterium]|nr:phenylalanine--tRNA ligase subunit beta [Gammaproteobacteria bacterium]
MRVNLEWLADWVELGDAQSVAADLTTAGLEVESVEPLAAVDRGIVVAEVLAVERHPNADRLSVCTVDDGAGRHQVVCGAPNVAAGIKAPFARVGSKLPNGKAIGAAELRGVKSNGMLCSAKELELVDDVDGLLILDADAPKGAPAAEHLRLDDAVLEVNVTPNRGDCFSVVGIARELAARREKALRRPAAAAVKATIKETLPIALKAGAACPRFAGRVLRGLSPTARTPLWMRERLRRAGVRPLQPIVDVTNYVMLELGQPMHAYDLAKLDGRIEARLARGGEKLTLLDGREVVLADDMLVIADARGPVGLAGVMGGQSTAVSEATDSVFLESAFFAPAAIAGRPRRVGLHTDASLRFERGVDPAGQARAVERATELLLQICGGSAGPIADVKARGGLPKRPSVTLRRERLRAVLGVDVPAKRVTKILERLEMKVKPVAAGWRVTPPAFRFDVGIEEDLIEEVGRMFGYDAIPSIPGEVVERLGVASEQGLEAGDIADLLAARGYAEAITYSFVDAALDTLVTPGSPPVELANPIASDMAVLRQSLWPGLISAARLNVTHQRQRLRLFELGPQFAPAEHGVAETAVVAGLALGTRAAEHWDGAGPEVDYYDVKGDVEAVLRLTGAAGEFRFEAATHPALSPGRTARILRGNRTVGWLGALHPELAKRIDKKRTAVVFTLQLGGLTPAVVPDFERYSRFPSIRRDLAIVVAEDVSAEALTKVVRAAAGDILQHVVVFDVYRGEGVDSRRKSIGLGLILQDASRTLTDEDADQRTRSVIRQLEQEFGATIRT